MRSDAKDPNTVVAKEILSYFLRNPEAADSLTEIARWRLMQERVRHSVEKTAEALKWLIGEGYMREEMRIGTGPIYQLNAERREAAEDFLEQRRESAEHHAEAADSKHHRENER